MTIRWGDDFEDFVRGRSGALLRTATLLVGDRNHAEDLLQEALWRTHRHWRDAAASPDAYARKVLVNLSHDRYRRTVRRVRETAFGPATPTSAPAPTTDFTERDALLQALRRLPQRQRAVVVLRFWDDLSIQDTAAALGCTPGTVKSTTNKALQRLRDVIAEDATPDREVRRP